MPVEIREEARFDPVAYGSVSIAFLVREIYAASAPESGLGGILLERQPVARPYAKDYDAQPGNHPSDWIPRLDFGTWAVFGGWDGDRRVGGAMVVMGSSEITLTGGRDDVGFLWDLRVAANARGQGIGRALFDAARAWATTRGARWLQIETQNVNVPACRFYRRMGCELGEIRRFGYAAVPAVAHEVMLNWYLDLTAGERAR